MRCPKCHSRILKSTVNHQEFFVKKLAINKSTGELLLMCHSCKNLIKASGELLKSFKSALLLLAEK